MALKNKDDKWHVEASQVWEKVLSGELTDLFTTDYVLGETVSHVLRNKSWGSWERAKDIGSMILESKEVKSVHVEGTDVGRGWEIFLKYQHADLTFTDCVSMAVMDRLGSKKVMGFDSDFEEVGRGYELVDG